MGHRSHLAPLPTLLAKRLVYPLVPLLDRLKPGFDPRYQPQLIPESTTRRLIEADSPTTTGAAANRPKPDQGK